jgi:ABC-2 type transport system permease protein
VKGLGRALRCELLKARRSQVPKWTAAGFTLAPLMGGLFMFILKDPSRARALGLLRAKAQIAAGTADWPTFLGIIAQATAVGGSFLFALVTAWVFGREFADRTAKLLLAVPTPRHAIVAAKLIVVCAWSALLCAWIFGVGLLVGRVVGLPGWSGTVLCQGAANVALTAVLAIPLVGPIAFLASWGRGYLAPLGFAVLTVFLAQITAATGWGAWFPWSVPPLLSGLAGEDAAALGAASYALVGLASLAGVLATIVWWWRTDHTT